MTTTRWRLYVTMETLWQQQDGGYMLLWKLYCNNKMAAMRYYGNVFPTCRWRKLCHACWLPTRWSDHTFAVEDMYTELVIDVFYIFNSTVIDWTCYIFLKKKWGPPSPLSGWYRMFLWVVKAVACSWSLSITGSVFSATPGENIFWVTSPIFVSHFTHTCMHFTHFLYPLVTYEIKMNTSFTWNNFALWWLFLLWPSKLPVFRIPVDFCGESRCYAAARGTR